MTDLLISTDTVVETDHGSPDHAHIIDRGDDERNAQTLLLEARVNGTPLTALCGYTWVPHKDPLKLPLCPVCEEMLPFAMSMRGITP